MLRPRCFGKSLFPAMQETYYCIDCRTRFDKLFKGLYIGQLRRYTTDEKVQKSKGHTKLRLITLIFRGWELETVEAV